MPQELSAFVARHLPALMDPKGPLISVVLPVIGLVLVWRRLNNFILRVLLIAALGIWGYFRLYDKLVNLGALDNTPRKADAGQAQPAENTEPAENAEPVENAEPAEEESSQSGEGEVSIVPVKAQQPQAPRPRTRKRR